jgi:PAS domain S-box-containing protein
MKDLPTPQKKTKGESMEDTRIQHTSDQNINSELDEKLKESESRYRRLFEAAQDGILILDFETGNITDANPFIVKIIDFPLEDVLGKKLWEIGLFSNKEESELAFIELKKNGYIRFDDMPIQRRNGKVAEVEFVSNVYLVNGAKVIQCNIRDITDRKIAERALFVSEKELTEQNVSYSNLNKEYANLNEELTKSINRIQHINNDLIIAKNKAEESDHLKSAFLANMSHEIRTPMNAIMGFSEFLMEPGLTKDELEKYIQIIQANSQRLLLIISDIIDISKIQAGQFSIKSENIDVNLLMNELLDTYQNKNSINKVAIHLFAEAPYRLVEIQTDGGRIKQIFCNLLNNAKKFTNEGEIEFGYELKEKFIRFFVKDTGIGIEPENLTFIFDGFRQVDAPLKKLNGGNGLGLTISKALVERLGGTIQVNSVFGKGSKFVFTIPYSRKI